MCSLSEMFSIKASDPRAPPPVAYHYLVSMALLFPRRSPSLDRLAPNSLLSSWTSVLTSDYAFYPDIHYQNMTRALIFITNGTEEMEFTIAYDTLVRAAIDTTSAGVDIQSQAVCTRGVKITPDVLLDSLSDDQLSSYDIVVIPGGGPGANTLQANKRVQKLFQDNYQVKGKLLGTICAGSLAIKSSGIAKGKAITSHPSVKGELTGDYAYSEDKVVVTDNLVSSRGPGTAFPFALTLVELALGKEKREEVAGPMVF